MTINNEFKKLLDRDGVQFTIILGSGFHRQALRKDSIFKFLGDVASTTKS